MCIRDSTVIPVAVETLAPINRECLDFMSEIGRRLLRASASLHLESLVRQISGLIRCDGKRPDGATLVHWARGKYVAWDATTIHTCAASYIHLTSIMPGEQPNMPQTGSVPNIH